jgi:hypothetical protein
MKRPFRNLLVFLGGVFLLVMVSNTWDYGFNCTRCLYYEHRLEHRWFGITFFETTSGRRDEHGRTYLELFGQPCTHIMKKGGFGHNPGCGMTTEGMVFAGRNKAVGALLELHRRHPDRTLALESMALVDSLFPVETQIEAYYRGRSQDTNMVTVGEMLRYAEWLEVVETSEEWRQVINIAARRDHAAVPAFLRDTMLLRRKLASVSPVVQAAAERRLRYSSETAASPVP